MSVDTSRSPDSSDVGTDFPPFVAPAESSSRDVSRREIQSRLGSDVIKPTETNLGSWRLEYEVGRGGMGIVYAAFDTLLGRRVALKLLPSMAAMEPKKLARFEHEAQVVARLSHPHIVPLYSMECEQGLHFLVMRLIDGASLDRVAANTTAALSSGSPDGTRIFATQAGDESSGRHGEDGTNGTHGTNGTDRPKLSHKSHESYTSHQTTPDPLLANNDGDRWLSDKLFGETHAACRYVATLGWQAAEALSYAHSMGVIHRDVKPSNLVVDRDHNLWITDFGLAQIQGEQGVTMTGDLLGTLRYMSPEQGMAQRIPVDHRTDVYSLGVTLYELLARRPAFEAADRKELLRQVLFDDPVPLRQRDPHIPWPLQVIVEKAMQKDARHRYATARAMADDLRRWLDGEPILARPPTVIERVSHWASRRKGAVATGLVSLFVLLAAWAMLSQRHAGELSRELEKTESARAEAERGQFEALLLQAQSGRAAERPGRRLQSLEAVTRAAELGRKLSLSESDRLRLRSETIAALGVPFDVEPLGTIDLDFPNRICILDSAFRQLARVTNNDGTLTVSKLDAKVVRTPTSGRGRSDYDLMDGIHLPGFGVLPSFWQFSLDGKRLIAEYGQTGGTIVVWNLESGERVYEVQLPAGWSWASTVALGDRTLAVVDMAGELRLFDLVELRETSRMRFGNPPTTMALTNALPGSRNRENSVQTLANSATSESSVTTKPDQFLVVGRAAPDRVEVLDANTLEVKQTIVAPGPMTLLLRSWSGGLVAMCRMATGYAFWDLVNSLPFSNTELPAYILDVSPQGDVIAFADYSENTKLRDTRTGHGELRLNGRVIGFDATGELLALQTTHRVSLYRVHRSEQIRRLRPPGQTAAVGIYNVSFSSDSRVMAVSTPGGARLYDVESGQLIDTVSNLTATSVAFLGSQSHLISRGRESAGDSDHRRESTPLGDSRPPLADTYINQSIPDDLLVSAVGVPLQRWRKVSIRWEQFERQFAIAEPVRPTSLNGNGFLSVSRDGRTVARCQFFDEAIVWRDVAQFTRLGPHPGLTHITLSPDGKRCVTGTHNGFDLLLWDTATGERLHNVWPNVPSALATFSPDGRWLLASTGREFRLFDTTDWKTVWQHAREDGSDAPAPVAFSPDGGQFAIAHNQSTMRLYSTTDRSLFAELSLPETSYIGNSTFSPNGRWLTRNTQRNVFVWDLNAIHDELSQRGIAGAEATR